MKSEPDQSVRSSTTAQSKPLLYSKALSSSLPPTVSIAPPPPTCSSPSLSQQQQQQQQQQQPQSNSTNSMNSNSNKQNFARNGPGRSGKPNGDSSNYSRNQQNRQYGWNSASVEGNGVAPPENIDPMSSQDSRQFISSPNGNGNGQFGGGQDNGRKSANGISPGHDNRSNSGQFNHHGYNNGQYSSNGRVGGPGGNGGGNHRDYEMSTTNLYICGLKPETTDEDLMQLCSPYGRITTTKAIMDRATNKCRGYGFVDFQDPGSAEMAMSNLKFQGVQAQMARCSEAKRNKVNVVNSPSEHDPTNLYIANLPLHMSEKDLESMLSKYGNVTSTRILKDTNGISRCVGFARMETREMCDSIIRTFSNKILPGCNEVLMVKYADGGIKKKTFKTNGSRYQNDDSQRFNDSSSMATNGVSSMLPSQLNGQAGSFQNAAQFHPFMNMGMGMPGNSQYPQGTAAGQQWHGAQAAQMSYGQMDPNALQFQALMSQMSQMNINNGYPYPFQFGIPMMQHQTVPVASNGEAEQGQAQPGLEGSGQQLSAVDGQSVQQNEFPHHPPGPSTAAMAAAMLYSQQPQN